MKPSLSKVTLRVCHSLSAISPPLSISALPLPSPILTFHSGPEGNLNEKTNPGLSPDCQFLFPTIATSPLEEVRTRHSTVKSWSAPKSYKALGAIVTLSFCPSKKSSVSSSRQFSISPKVIRLSFVIISGTTFFPLAKTKTFSSSILLPP